MLKMTKNENKKKISVILPVYNDPKGVSVTLNSLLEQDTSLEYEILVIDNNSKDDTPKVIDNYEKSNPKLIRSFVEREVQSSYAARNKGIDNADGEVLAFIDSDMWVSDDWIEKIAEIFDDVEQKYFGMNVEIVDEKESFSALYDKITGFPVQDYIENDHFCPTCCLVVSKEIIEDIGKFNENLISSGDREFGHRVYEKGYEQSYMPEIKMYHPARSSFKSHVKKWIRLGRGVYQLSKNYPQRYSNEKRNVLNPIYYIPPSPEIIEGIKERGKTARFTKNIGVVSMKWIEKIFTHYGYIYEKYND